MESNIILDILTNSKYTVAFTGAGISTDSGLPDYRGPNGIRKRPRKEVKNWSAVDFNELLPNKGHMGLAELVKMNLVQHVISQNIDNLHVKSGIPRKRLTELHGNACTAVCDTCGVKYISGFPENGLCSYKRCTSLEKSIHARLSGRTRKNNGILKRYVVGFKDELDTEEAMWHCQRAEVALILGTSLKVEPFATMAMGYAPTIVLVNAEPTSSKFDQKAQACGVRSYQTCSVVLENVLKVFKRNVDFEVPIWQGEHPEMFTPRKNDDLVQRMAGSSGST